MICGHLRRFFPFEAFFWVISDFGTAMIRRVKTAKRSSEERLSVVSV
jgi:hypothetical protein